MHHWQHQSRVVPSHQHRYCCFHPPEWTSWAHANILILQLSWKQHGLIFGCGHPAAESCRGLAASIPRGSVWQRADVLSCCGLCLSLYQQREAGELDLISGIRPAASASPRLPLCWCGRRISISQTSFKLHPFIHPSALTSTISAQVIHVLAGLTSLSLPHISRDGQLRDDEVLKEIRLSDCQGSGSNIGQNLNIFKYITKVEHIFCKTHN